jgi:diadenosine tetraphosphatase ApaH/serine/threonine PP2A family protein phosphatase
MRYLVFSDVHGNVEALEQVLEHAARHRPDIIVSLGDVVGYGANPNECVDMVDEYAQIRVGGNHDLAVAGITAYDDFNSAAKSAIQWTAKIMQPRCIEHLSRYDATRRHEDCVFAHASPENPLDWEYIYTMKQARALFETRSERFIFVGHTHIPSCISWSVADDCRALESSIIQLAPCSRYFVNVGSIGQPRDGVAAASYALLDTKKETLSIRRIPYDIELAQEKIRSAGLPESLAARLVTAT